MKMMMMMKQEESTGGGAVGEASAITNWGGHRVCHTCGGTSSSAAYSCSACDRNERVVRICDACELAPAVLYCKADAASLCPSCDAHIHSVNHLARRHHRVSILHPGAPAEEEGGQNDDDEAASWLLPNPHDDGKLIINMNEAALVVDDNKEDLDTVEYMSTTEEGYGYGGGGEEGVVPFQLPFERYHNFNVTSLFDDDDFYDDDSSSSPKPSTSTNYNHHAVNYMEVGVVPDDDESTEKGRFVHQEMLTSTTNSSTSPAAIKLRGKEREARVVRYREKKLRRKFEKTIRYASRKAYAETRPRIKGRFAKRSSKLVNNINIDHHHSLFSAAAPIISSHDDQTSSTGGGGGGGSYGQVVPSLY